MKFYMLSTDELYLEAVEKYYLKYFRQKVTLDFRGEIANDAIIITENDFEIYKMHHCIKLGKKNDPKKYEINKYQDYESFFAFLQAFTLERKQAHTDFDVYHVVNLLGGLGSTTISLNMAETLSSDYKTFWLSLDVVSKYGYYLPQNAQYSLSDVVFYLKQNAEHSDKHFDTDQSFDYFNTHEYIEDIYCLDEILLTTLSELLKSKGYQKVVIDYGQRLQLAKLNVKKHLFLISGHNHHHYHLISDVQQYLDVDVQVLVNQRRMDYAVDDRYLNHLTKYAYIDYDHRLEKEGNSWHSTIIQNQLKNILSLL